LGASKIIALASIGSATTPLLFKKPVQCQGKYTNMKLELQNLIDT
jgi:hypothetical protein